MDWADRWLESNEFALVKSEITQLKAESLAKNTVVDKSLQSEYAVNILEQLRIVFFRTTLSFWRNPNYGFTRLFNHLSISLGVHSLKISSFEWILTIILSSQPSVLHSSTWRTRLLDFSIEYSS